MSKEAIEFYHWMMKNDTPENADKYFHWSDDDMYNEFLKQKNSTKENDIPHSDIRRMESEGVYEEKFQRNSSSPTYFNDEWNKVNNDVEQLMFDEAHVLDMVMNDMVKDFTDDDIECILEANDNPKEPNEALMDAALKHDDYNDDESTYVDGVDERPIKKETEYNDDSFDY